MPTKSFLYLGLGTALVLLLPLIAMQFSSEMNWTLGDFFVMGTLIYGMGSLFLLLSRRVHQKHRLLLGGVILFAFLYIWAELAVGVFTNLGS